VSWPRTQQANLPAYLHTIHFYAERQAGKLWIKGVGRKIFRGEGDNGKNKTENSTIKPPFTLSVPSIKNIVILFYTTNIVILSPASTALIGQGGT